MDCAGTSSEACRWRSSAHRWLCTPSNLESCSAVALKESSPPPQALNSFITLLLIHFYLFKKNGPESGLQFIYLSIISILSTFERERKRRRTQDSARGGCGSIMSITVSEIQTQTLMFCWKFFFLSFLFRQHVYFTLAVIFSNCMSEQLEERLGGRRGFAPGQLV